MELGDLSAKYESNGDPGTISSGEGDAGGVSYGAYQFASNAGVPQAFVNWLIEQGYSYANDLAQYEVGTDAFNESWSNIAQNDPQGFLEMQRQYVQEQYYNPSAVKLEAVYYNVANHSEAIRQVVWSASVQYGTGYIVELFQTACSNLGYANLSYVDSPTFDADMIKAIYDIRASDEWTAASPELRPGLRARFESECQDALNMLGQGMITIVKKDYIYIIVIALLVGIVGWSMFGIHDNRATVDAIRAELNTVREQQQSAINRLTTIETGLAESQERVSRIESSIDSTTNRIEQSQARVTDSAKLISDSKSIIKSIREGNTDRN